MTYREFLKSDLLLPKKENYTMRDLKKLMIESLKKGVKPLTRHEAKRLIILSATFHDTDWSNSLGELDTNVIEIG